jgi:hypothetical protein
MNRNSTQTPVRDLLDTGRCPNTSSQRQLEGFDNIGGVLSISPALFERYMSAARRISRLAVGDMSAASTPVTYRAPKGLSQRSHLDGMPLGTQGGMTAHHNFPLDAEYEIRAGAGRVDLTIDGKPVSVTGRGARLAIPAGPHTIGAALVRSAETATLDDIFSAPERGGGGISTIITGPFQPAVLAAHRAGVAYSSARRRRQAKRKRDSAQHLDGEAQARQRAASGDGEAQARQARSIWGRRSASATARSIWGGEAQARRRAASGAAKRKRDSAASGDGEAQARQRAASGTAKRKRDGAQHLGTMKCRARTDSSNDCNESLQT